jgi:glucose-6-phosphate isomerase
VSGLDTTGLGRFSPEITRAIEKLGREHFVERLWQRDPALWSSEPACADPIKARLGWLASVSAMRCEVPRLREFADTVRREGFTHALLLGMGGSSLCPELLRLTFGVRPGFLDLAVLDSTDPAEIMAAERRADTGNTLFIVSSKSGTTAETIAFFRYFFERARAVRGRSAGSQFVAITDPETPLERLAKEHDFRRTFLNPPDIGGRYSALSLFGLVSAALLGIDLEAFLERAGLAVSASAPHIPPGENPGVTLGAVIGALALAGRDKLTLVLSRSLESFGSWVEQLIAESLGKEGRGVVPVEGEPLGLTAAYGDDRLFVAVALKGEEGKHASALASLRAAGHPVASITLRDRLDLAGEFFRWEVAAAAAGALLGVNPFDEPNVTESKERTNRLLAHYEAAGKLPEIVPCIEENGISLYGSSGRSLREGLTAHFNKAKAGDYLALMAYLPRESDTDAPLQSLRATLRDRLRIATTLGYGPRFLHSTGQLHKGGPPSGLFLQITHDDPVDLPIPGRPYSFGALERAQALGDLEALVARGLRVIGCCLRGDRRAGIRRLVDLATGGIHTKKTASQENEG